MRNQKHKVPEWKLFFIEVNHVSLTTRQMAAAFRISDTKVLAYCKQLRIKAKPSEFHKKNRTPGVVYKFPNQGGHPRMRSSKVKTAIVQRPPAVYSNTNFLNIDNP